MSSFTTNVFQHEDGYWVFTIESVTGRVYQDIDYIRGGRLETKERAEELMNDMLDKQRSAELVPSPEQEILKLKQENAQLKTSDAQHTLDIIDLWETILG